MERERVFLEAWRVFRRDMDGLAGARVHPDVVDEWFRAMPVYLMGDMVRIATSREVLFRAAQGMLAARPARGQEAVAALVKAHPNEALIEQLEMLAVRFGGTRTKQALYRGLDSSVSPQRFRAARRLAGGGDGRGIAYLKKIAAEQTEQGAAALAALSRYAPLNERALIERVAKQHPTWTAARAALGEMAFRRRFPDLYRLLLTRYRFERQRYKEDGLYETWMVCMAMAEAAGARREADLRRILIDLRKEPPFQRDAEAARRQVSAFLDFLESAGVQLRADADPDWPDSFSEAVRRMRTVRARGVSPDDILSQRIGATIRLLSELGPLIGYERFASPTRLLRALSPLGERALDGNLATSWRARRSGRLVIDHPAGAIRALHVMVGCPGAKGGIGTIDIEIRGGDGERGWSLRHRLDDEAHFFQTVPMKHTSAGRLEIRFEAAHGNDMVCVPELRIF